MARPSSKHLQWEEIAEHCIVKNRIGSYESTPEEQAQFIEENRRRGTLHLIQERNSFKHRDNAGRHEQP